MDINKAKANRARWFDIVTRSGEFAVLVEPFGNRDWRNKYKQLTAPYARHMRMHDGELPDGKSDEVLIRCTAETILKDWKGITDGEDDVPFSVDRAVEFLTEIDDFRNGVSDAALTLSKVYAAEKDDSEKNSASASAGTSLSAA